MNKSLVERLRGFAANLDSGVDLSDLGWTDCDALVEAANIIEKLVDYVRASAPEDALTGDWKAELLAEIVKEGL